ncbi:hypothetical protein Tco_0527815 [Tanacetum coccineum]
MLDQHRKELYEQFSQILSTIMKSKTPESEAPTFAITTRSGVSTQDPPFPAPSQSTSANNNEEETKKEGPEDAKPSIQEPAPQPSILYQPSNSSNLPFPSRLKKQKKDDEDERLLSIFKQIHINLPFLEAMIHMPKGANVTPFPRSLNLFLVCLDRLCHLAILCLDQHAHTLHHLESLLTISLDRLDILKEDIFEHEHVVMNPTSAGMRHLHLHLYMNPEIKQLAINRVDEYGFVQFGRTSLTGFPAQSVRSSNAYALDSPYLLVLNTGASQSRQHGKSESDSYYLSD